MKNPLLQIFGAAALSISLATTSATASADKDCGLGEICRDGTVNAGVSIQTGQRIYTTQTDAPGLFFWNDGSNKWSETGLSSLTNGQSNSFRHELARHSTRSMAIEYCSNLNFGGHSDWYLPAVAELLTLYYNRQRIGRFDEDSGKTYWSSSEATSIHSETVDFSDGSEMGAVKNSRQHVRCIRQPS